MGRTATYGRSLGDHHLLTRDRREDYAMTSFMQSHAPRLDDLDSLRQYHLCHLDPQSGRGFCLARSSCLSAIGDRRIRSGTAPIRAWKEQL